MKKNKDDKNLKKVNLHLMITSDMDSKLRGMAQTKGLDLSSLVRLWISERLEEEKVK